MKILPIFILATALSVSIDSLAAGGTGSFYSNAGATLISHNSQDEAAYYIEIGYTQQLDEILSVDLNYKKIETFNSSISTGSDDFVQAFDTYGIGLRADQSFGDLSLYAKAGASFVTSETTTWDATAGAEKIESDDSIKPYASAGLNLASPYDKRLTFGLGIDYQMLANDDHAVSFSGGINYGF